MKLLHWELPSVCSVTHQSLVVCAPEQCPPFGSAENIYFHVAEVQAELWGVCLWHVWTSEYRGDLSGADWSLVFVSIVVAEVLTFSNEGVHSLLQKIIRGSCFSCCFLAQRRDPASAGVKCLLFYFVERTWGREMLVQGELAYHSVEQAGLMEPSAWSLKNWQWFGLKRIL